jgi:hypothetical protein
MTDRHAGLELYGAQLRTAIARDRRRTPRRLIAGAAAVPVAVAIAAALLLTAGGGPQVSAADAAILRHVDAVLSPAAGTVLHEQAMVTAPGEGTQPFELWLEGSAPHRYQVHKWGHVGFGSGGAADDPAATLRAMVQSGQATVDASTTYDGVPAYKLTVAGAPDRWLNGTAYVARSDYRPVEIDSNGEQIRYTNYESLPATAANLACVTPGAGRSC